MARTEKVLSVFVSSPSDVKDEVEIVGRVIDELNRTSLRAVGLRFEMINWQRDVVPGVSGDVQKLINEQIGDEYDIFLGILWARFGRPTPRAGSGTEEEFERAYARYKQQPDSLQIMVYFKTSALKLDAIDPDQIKQVRNFKSQLGEKGGLYCEFETPESFEVLLRSHLTLQAQRWGKRWGDNSAGTLIDSRSVCASPLVDREAEEGALDLVESGVENFLIATDSLSRVTQLLEDLTTRAEAKTTQLSALRESTVPDKMKEGKRIINSTAVDLDQFANRLADETKVISRSLLGGLDAFSRLLTYRDCVNEKDLASLVELGAVIMSIPVKIESVKQMNSGLAATLKGLPRMTTLLNGAKKSAVNALEQFDTVLEEALQLSEDANRNFDLLFSGRVQPKQ